MRINHLTKNLSLEKEGRRKKEEGRRKKEEGRRKLTVDS
jgi:hypothetical protein